MLIGFDYYVELESARHVPVFIKPSKIRGMLAVENGKRTRITFWDGNSYLVEGSITKVAETLFNPQKKKIAAQKCRRSNGKKNPASSGSSKQDEKAGGTSEPSETSVTQRSNHGKSDF